MNNSTRPVWTTKTGDKPHVTRRIPNPAQVAHLFGTGKGGQQR